MGSSSGRKCRQDARTSKNLLYFLKGPDYFGPHIYEKLTLVICNTTCMKLVLSPQVTVEDKIPSRINLA
jgi:hypothetical protein